MKLGEIDEVLFPYMEQIHGCGKKADKERVEEFEMWIWRRMEGIKYTR